MHEREYLGHEDVAAFSSFLRDVAIAGCPAISFKVGAGKHRRQVTTLLEALEGHSWRGQRFEAIFAKDEAMRREMHAALEHCERAEGSLERRLAELELLFVSTKTLSLDQVYEGAFPFLIHQAETGLLSTNLRLAAALIDGAAEEVSAFDDKPYRSDCAMTKVYAVINQRTLAYDDRLGAALGLLCRRHLEREGERRLPDRLAFMVGDQDNSHRNPSGNGFRFGDKRPGREHARWNIRANWIITRVVEDPAVVAVMGGTRLERIRRLEAALFMLGDDVHDQPRLRVQPRVQAMATTKAQAGPLRAPWRARAAPGVNGSESSS